MNKHCYRIIFSRTQGELRVVSELARSCSTMPGQSRSNGGARLWVTLRPAMLLIGLALFAEPVLANGIVADGQQAAAQRPEVITTQNGLPQVNINAPNQAGVSHNRYQQFDVGPQGAILNNSAVMTSTQLAGYIQGNAKLDPNAAPAKVIINEVNSNNPSQLRGFLEVAGGKAQVVVANPAGILCDGCGTINAGRMTLTTGKPQLNADGSVAGYQVERGVIQVEGGGLNGDSRHDTEYVDILARAVQVNSGIWAKEAVSVVAGRNQIGADGKTVTALAAAGDSVPDVAIDMGQMGGMYSGHIRMVGTEAGVGVRNQGGHLQAEKTLVVSSEGKLIWQAGTTEPNTQAGGDITLTARDSVEHQGKLHSGGELTVQSRQGKITQSGTLAAAGNVTLRSEQGIQSSGHLLAGSDANSTLIRPADLTLDSQGDIRASGSLLSQKKISVTGRRVDLSQSRLAAEQAVLTARAGDVALQQAQVDSQQFTVNSQGNVDTQQAQIRAGRWQITANSLFNQAGVWSQVGTGESRFALTGELDNTDGSIEAQQLNLNTRTLNNLRGRLVALDGTAQHWRVSDLLVNHSGVVGSNGSLQLELGTLDNQQGTLQSQSHLVLTAQRGVNNNQGKLLAGGDLALNSQAAVNNRAGEIRGQNLQLTTQALHNAQGLLVSQGGLRLDAQEFIDNQQGLIEAGETLDISTAGEWDNRKGTALGAKQANVAVGSLNNAAGKLQSGGGLVLRTTGNVDNQAGFLTAQQDLSWQGGALSLFNNDEGKLLSGGDLSLSGGQLNNRQQGWVQSQQALTVDLAGALDNQGGKLASGGSSTLRALNLVNTQGEIEALGSLDMQFTRALDNRNGNIISQRAQRLQAENIFNTQGWIGSLGTLTLASQGVDNRDGQIVSQQDADLSVTSWDNQHGTLQSAGNLILRTVQDVYNQGGKISAQAHLWLQGLANSTPAGVLHNAGGQLLAGEQLSIQAQDIDNRQNGLLYSQKQLQLTLKGTLDNRLGKLQSGEGMQFSAAQLLNTQGIIDSQQQLNAQISGALDNTQGTVRANQALQIATDVLQNQQGVISSLGGIQLTANQLVNQTGTVISQGTGHYQLGHLNNQQGKLHSGGALTLNSNSLDNQAGQLISSQDVTLNSVSIDNRYQGIISSQGALNLSAEGVNNRDGGLLIGTTQMVLNTRYLDNTAGRVQSAGTLTLSRLDTLDNRQGALLANGALSISGGYVPSLALFNQGGNIQSGGALTASVQSFDNQGGTLLSQQALTLSVQQDYTHRAGDTISSNQSVTLSVAGVLTNLADWLLPGDLTLHSAHFTNLASLVGKTLHLTTGALLNQGRIEADTLAFQADSVDNQATLMADNLVINSRIIDNHGREALIAATEHIDLITGERLTNRDGALIYSAGSLSLSSGDLIENRASNIEAEGDLTLESRRFDNLREGLEIARAVEKSDYKWHRYNYYWRSYGSTVNTDVSTMAPTTQQLTFRDDAAADSNPYGTLLNIDAANKRAEVRVKNSQGQLVDLWVNYLALLPNSDGSYAITFYETRGQRQNFVPTPYQNTVWREHDRGRLEQWNPELHLDIANIPFVTDYNNLRERTVTGTVTSDKLVSAGIGAFLLSGGNMVLRITEQLLNDASTVSANGNLTLEGTANIINRGYSVNERRQEVIVDHYDRNTNHWYPTFNRDETTALTTIDGVISGYGQVTLSGAHLDNTTVNQAQISAVEAAQNAAAAERAEWERNPLSLTLDGGDWQAADMRLAEGSRPLTPGELALTDQQHLTNVATTIPNNGLFRQQTAANSPFLVVTDPRFTNRNQFLSSDYLLQRVGYDPSQVHKRLGDGYYEQRVVREQLLMLTGRPSLQGEDAMAQYQALMNNGIQAAEDFHLVPGVALTPAQIAALQQDIVWLVSETVDTAEGPQTVWVPKVYLANSTVRVTGDGAVIAGGNLQLSTGSLSNAGNLFADKALNIDTGTFLHQGGDIRADTLNVQADSLSLSTNLQDALRQASMSARELSLSGGDISLQGAKLSATENLSLSASNSLHITTARSSSTADVSVIAGAMGNRTSAGMEEAGERMAQVSGEWQQALGSSLTSGGNLSLKAGQDITLQGSQVQAEGQLGLQAGGNVSLLADTTTNDTHLKANSRTSTVSNSRREETLHTSTLSGGQGVSIQAGGDFVAEGAQVESASGGIGLNAQQVTIKEARQRLDESDSEQNKVGKTQSQRQITSSSDVAQGSVFSAKEGVTVTARQGDITVQGSTVQSERGDVALQASNNINLEASYDDQQRTEQGSSSSKGFLSSSQSRYRQDDSSHTANGSVVSGNNVSLSAGNDLTVKGSAVVGDGQIDLHAGNNVEIVAATETQSSHRVEEKKKSGLMSSGGIGFSVGSTSSKHEVDERGVTQSQSVSTIGSTGGDVNIVAGGKAHIGGADVIANQNLSVTGDSVQIDPGQDSYRRDEKFEQKTSGLTVALSGAAGGAVNTAVNTAQQAQKETDDRLAALQGTKAALSGVQAGQAVALEQAKGGNIKNTVGVSASLGSQKSSSESHTQSSTASGSTLTAGNTLSVTATGKGNGADSGDIAIAGSQLKAGGETTLNAERDILLSSAANSQQTTGKNSSSGFGVGVDVSTAGVTASANANKSQGSEKGNGTQWVETTIDSGKQVNITSGRDTTLSGAQVSGDSVKMDVGRDLTLSSQQDSDRYDAKQTSVSGGVSVPIGSAGGGVQFSTSRDKLHSNYDSVQEQTGIYAGQGGFDITVGNHTQLDGAVIGSTATADKNRLDTGTLGFSDIENKAEFKTEHQGGSFSTSGSILGNVLSNSNNLSLAGANSSDQAEGTTQAAVSEGTLIIRDKDSQQQDIADLSRDVENANGSIAPIFDKEKEQNRLKQAQLIGEIGGQAIDIIRTQGDINGLNAAREAHLNAGGKPLPENATVADKEAYAAMLRETPEYQAAMKQYGTGSDLQKAAQAVTAALQGLAGGNMAAAIAGGLSPYAAEQIKKYTGDNDTANVLAHAVWGAIAAEMSGNSAAAGAAGAAGGELAARYLAGQLYGADTDEKIAKLSEEQKQNISALSTLVAGLAGGVIGDSSANALVGAQAGKNAVENNFLSVQEKTELELAKQKLQNSNDPAEREQAQQKINELREKDIASDKKVIEACGNGAAASAACASARLEVIAAKGEYEIGPYNSKVSQQYADAYGQIVNLLNITSVDAQNQQQVKDAMVNYAMVQLGVDKATAEAYIETYDGMKIVAASLTPILGTAAAKQLSKIVDANLKVVAKGNVDGNQFTDTNQGIRPSQLADFNKPTLINDVVQAKIDKRPDKNYPNGNMGTAHAEVGVIQQAFDKGMTQGREMAMSVAGKEVCNYCLSDVRAMAEKAGLKSLTIYEEATGNVLFWQQGMNKIENRGPTK
ncbi:hemagglutinin repeat-containing protein [Chania multitudinisentens]|uniref:hemagglutinin repeat-containing protein n=1 Tax=Chania multitudinisentens TaxID=1639108 RepID=UPI0003E14030|nr:hemagglutinin repeat-containing protein [Chania multitudinisentens]